MVKSWMKKYWRNAFAASQRYIWLRPVYWVMFWLKCALLNLLELREAFLIRRLRHALDLGLNSAGTPKPVEYFPLNPVCVWPDTPGAYVRLDFWAPLLSGGSYGHTCFVAKELDALSPGLECAMAHTYPLLENMGIKQTRFISKTRHSSDAAIIIQGQRYEASLLEWLRNLKPSFIYERVCLGSMASARAARQLGIPYFAEYNGSELEMRMSYDDADMTYAGALTAIEEWALRQATVISVVSEQIKLSLVRRGFDPARICVNPNGVDIETYCPLPEAEKNKLKAELGFRPDDVVLCFIGTFGGWHGVEVLAEVMPKVLNEVPNARFLLIGDGNFKHLIDSVIEEHGLQEKVVCTGNVPQMEGRRLLQAADIYLSPHSGHMKNMPFFGSPTKLFEYMALGGAIVASDLEQIGQVLRPAFFVKDIMRGEAPTSVGVERAILCEPGNADEFAAACIFAAQNPALCTGLGSNARSAAKETFTWEKHVERLWRFAAGDKNVSWEKTYVQEQASELECFVKESGEQGFSDNLDQAGIEAQKQWNTNPCGAVDGLENLDLDYFLRVEQNRYEENPFIREVFPFERFAGKKVLEIGCGHGTDSAQFAKHGALCHIVDITDRHLELSRRNFELRGFPLEWKRCDATAIDYPDNYFDCVYSFGVIHHIPDVELVLQEAKRVLKPGGTLCLAVYNKFSAFHIFSKLLYDGVFKKRLVSLGYEGLLATIESGADGIYIRPYVRLYGEKEFKGLLEQNGFTACTPGVSLLTREHFSSCNSLLWPLLCKYENKLGWYVHAQATKQ